MTVNEIFARVASNQVKGLMLHNDLADYYDFLGLMGFKRMHEYHFLCEMACMRGVHRYYINHYNMLLEDTPIQYESVIPDAWRNFTRQAVEPAVKRDAVKTSIEKWVGWERGTKVLYEELYAQLVELKETAALTKMQQLLDEVSCELKYAERLHLKMLSSDYSMDVILPMQDCLHEKYKKKSKKVGVSIC